VETTAGRLANEYREEHDILAREVWILFEPVIDAITDRAARARAAMLIWETLVESADLACMPSLVCYTCFNLNPYGRGRSIRRLKWSRPIAEPLRNPT
jgi:hypothetical protein